MKAQIKTTGTAVLPSDKYDRVLSWIKHSYWPIRIKDWS